MGDNGRMGVTVRGYLRVIKEGSFKGKDGDVQTVKVYLDVERAYPEKVEAIGGGAAALLTELEGKTGEVVEIPVYMNTQGKYPTLRYAGSGATGE